MPVEISFDPQDAELLSLLKQVGPFTDLSDDEIQSVAANLKKYEYDIDEVVVKEGEMGSTAYIVCHGHLSLNIMGQKIREFIPGDFFGEIALIDTSPRMGTVRATKKSSLYCIEGSDLESEERLSSRTAMKIYRGFSRLITSYMREGSNLYKDMDVLLIQDGGCAPGYNPVTAFISESLEKAGREVFICAEGFCSLMEDKPQNYRRLIYNTDQYRKLEHLPGVIFSPPLRESPGADFRTERFPQFTDMENQEKAAKHIKNLNVKIVVGIGGNGTFVGTKSLSRFLPETVQVFFVPVTIDSDIYGTDCIGEYTGVEVGSEKIRCYMADSRTHHRIYIIEMMGAHGGYHALNSCLGAGAHLAVLPNSEYDLNKIASSLNTRQNAVIVVAEGYKVEERKKNNYHGNAAEFFREELLSTGVSFNQRLICEPFSRDIRGAKPNNLDIMLAQRMARKLTELVLAGKSQLMPAVLSGKEYSIPFDKIRTDNSVESDLASLANRL